MKNDIDAIKQQIELFEISTAELLEEFKRTFLGKQGLVQEMMAGLKNMPAEQRKETGVLLNDLKKTANTKYEQNRYKFSIKGNEEKLHDYTLPGQPVIPGSRHSLSIVNNQLVKVFRGLGFSITSGPEIEDDWHNFTALNFPPEHPARDMQDTFFVDHEIALRTHTSSVQVRLMENKNPPLRCIMPGRVYRNEAISARANCFFHQIEGLYVDRDVSFADLKQVLYEFVKQFFGANCTIRFRPSYFPFTEPSAEMDVSCFICQGKGCPVCKQSGWVEILGCGMVDPIVLQNCGHDPEIFSGYAFGMGIERITMLKYGINDIRVFFDNDIRFLKQFS